MIKLKNLLKEETSKLDTAKELYNKAIDLWDEIGKLQKEQAGIIKQYNDLRNGLLDDAYNRLIDAAKKLHPNAKGVKKVGDGVLVQLPKGEYITQPYNTAVKLASEMGTEKSVKVAGRYENYSSSGINTQFNGFYAEFSVPYIKSVTNLPAWSGTVKKLK